MGYNSAFKGLISLPEVAVFILVHNFSLPLFAPTFICHYSVPVVPQVKVKVKVKQSHCRLGQDRTGPEGSRKLRFPDFVTTAQDGGRLSALRTGCLYH